MKGFRLAQFGMSEKQVIQAIEADFGLLEKKLKDGETQNLVNAF